MIDLSYSLSVQFPVHVYHNTLVCVLCQYLRPLLVSF